MNGIGLFVSVDVPDGGVEFHTHPDLHPKSVNFSSGDLVVAMKSGAVASYIFYGYPGDQGRKLDIKSAEPAEVSPYRREINNYIQDLE